MQADFLDAMNPPPAAESRNHSLRLETIGVLCVVVTLLGVAWPKMFSVPGPAMHRHAHAGMVHAQHACTTWATGPAAAAGSQPR